MAMLVSRLLKTLNFNAIDAVADTTVTAGRRGHAVVSSLVGASGGRVFSPHRAPGCAALFVAVQQLCDLVRQQVPFGAVGSSVEACGRSVWRLTVYR